MYIYVDIVSVTQAGWVPLYRSFESFYNRNIYRLIRDCWNRPISSAPSAEFDLLERVTNDHGWTFTYVGLSVRKSNAIYVQGMYSGS